MFHFMCTHTQIDVLKNERVSFPITNGFFWCLHLDHIFILTYFIAWNGTDEILISILYNTLFQGAVGHTYSWHNSTRI